MIKALERVLGEMRKTERNMQHRSYIPKTNILKEVELQNQHQKADACIKPASAFTSRSLK